MKAPHWRYTTLTLERRIEMLRKWIEEGQGAKKGSIRFSQQERYKEELKNYAKRQS